MSETIKKYLDDAGLKKYNSELIDYIANAVSTKVDQVTGKGLSTNDYTTTEKNKLANIESGANKTIVDSALSSTSTNPVQNKVLNEILVEISDTIEEQQAQIDSNSDAVSDHTGNTTVHIVSAERTNWNAAKTHADSAHAPSNAEENQNTFSNITIGETTIAADSKTDTLTLVGSNVTLTPDATNDKITISVANGSTSAKGVVKLTNSTSSTSTTTAATPNSVKSAYDLANTANTAAATAQSTADSKIASVSLAPGTNNGTVKLTVDGTATDNIAVKGLGSAAYTASSAYAAASHGTHVTYSSTVPVMNGTASVGSASTVSRSDHVHPVDTSRAAANHTHSAYVNQNAYSNVVVGDTTISADSATDTLTLVAGSNITLTPTASSDTITIAAKDTVYTHPSYTEKASGLYKMAVDSTGHVVDTTAVTKSDITALGIPSSNTKNTAGSTDSSSKLFLIGATSQAANPQTYSHDTAYVGTDGCLYSNSTKVSVDGHTHSYAGSASAGGAATKAISDQNGVQIDRAYCSMIPFGTAVAANSDLNTVEFLAVGNYYCSANKTVKTLVNCPTTSAFMMQVYSPLSTTIDNESTKTWCYRLRKMFLYTGQEYVQYVHSEGTAGTFIYDEWQKVIKDGDVVDTATKLETARTIQTNLGSTSTASFDGSENITPGVTGTLGIGNGGTGATTAASVLTNLGLTATATELNYCDGVTSSIQTQLNAKVNTSDIATVTEVETYLGI